MRSRSTFPLAALLMFAILSSMPAEAASRLRLATVAPKGSSFHNILVSMGNEWNAQGVELRIYPGGTRGGEADIVSLMRNGALDAALLTTEGLVDIDPSVQALQSIPLLFRSLAEVDYVGERLRPRIEKRLRERGFVVLFWTDAGWVRFFSKAPIRTPDDLRKAKLFTWAGDPSAVDLYRKSGFHPVALETNDILPSLQTGMIDTVPLPPYVALATQMFVHAPHMLQLDWAALLGALVVTEKSWNALTPAQQRELAHAAADAGRVMKQKTRLESERSVSSMELRGLKVTRIAPAMAAEWYALLERKHSEFRGGRIAVGDFDEVLLHLRQYRNQQPVNTAGKP